MDFVRAGFADIAPIARVARPVLARVSREELAAVALALSALVAVEFVAIDIEPARRT
jgi:hypothetical protein